MSRVFLRRRAAAFALAATAAIAVPAVASADPTIVSKMSGPSGLPFPATLTASSSDGRYVIVQPRGVINNGDFLPADGPEASVDNETSLLRDEQTDTTTPLQLKASPTGPALQGTAIGISDDGNEVLFSSDDPAILAAGGVPASAGDVAVEVAVNRTTGALSFPRLTPASPTIYGDQVDTLLSADGTTFLFTTTDGTTTSIYRAPLAGGATLLISRPDLELEGASADLNTVLYQRPLLENDRPVPATGQYVVNSFTDNALGVVVGTDAPRLVLTGSYVDDVCHDGVPGPYWVETKVNGGLISADGARVAADVDVNSDFARTDEDQNEEFTRLPDGTVVKYAGGDPFAEGLFSHVVTLAATHNLTAIEQTQAGAVAGSPINFGGNYIHVGRLLYVGGDTQELWSAGDYAPVILTPRYVYSQPSDVAADAPSDGPLSLAGTTVDTPDVKTPATWNCGTTPAVLPVGPIAQYETTVLAKPVRTGASAGTVTTTLAANATYRGASKVTLQERIFGFVYWSKTVTTSTSVKLPNPLLWLPTQLRVTVQPLPSGTTPATPLVANTSFLALR